MLSEKQYKALKVGDAFEAGVMFPPLSKEQIMWHVLKIDGEGKNRVVTLTASYLNLPFGVYEYRYPRTLEVVK
jgi:hypothetical protein